MKNLLFILIIILLNISNVYSQGNSWKDISGSSALSSGNAKSIHLDMPYLFYSDHGYSTHNVLNRTYNSSTNTWTSDNGSNGGYPFGSSTSSIGYSSSMSAVVDHSTSQSYVTSGAGSARVSKGAGTSWTTSTVNSTQTWRMSIALDGSTPYTIFEESTGAFSVKYLNGSSWSYSGNANFSPSTKVYSPDIAFGTNSTPYVAYKRGTVSDKKVRVLKLVSNVWTQLGSNDATSDALLYRLAVDGSTPYVAYSSGSYTFSVKKLNGTTGAWEFVGGYTSIAASRPENFNIKIHNSEPYVIYDDHFGVHVKKFDGTSWVVVGSSPIAGTNGASVAGDLDFDGNTMYVAYDGGSAGNYLTVQELLPCPDPYAMSTSNTVYNSTDLSWSKGNSETAWDIKYKADFDFNPSSSTSGATTISVSNNVNYSLTGLSAETTYYVYYRANCGGGDESTWVGPYSFTTPSSCLIPSGMTKSNITATSTKLSWTAGSIENAWQIMWKDSYFTTVNTTGATTVTATTNSNYTLNGLTPNTQHYIFYRAYCSSSDQSDWVGPFYVTTPPTCPAPSAMTLDSASYETAMVSWTAGDAETQWNVKWKAGYFPSSNLGDSSLVATTNTDIAITGLDPLTEYYLYYQADCGGGDESDWVGPFLFNTTGVGDGTVSSKEVISGTTSGFNTYGVNMMELNNKLVFSSTQGLYEYDGTSLSPVLDSTGAAFLNISNLIVINGELFFSKSLSSGYSAVFKYDGISSSIIEDINGNNLLYAQLRSVDNNLLVQHYDASWNPMNSRYNGSYFELVSLPTGAFSYGMLNGALLYTKSDYKLYKNINGVETEIKDASNASFASDAYYFLNYNGQLIVSGGSKSWLTDGTTATNIQSGAGANITYLSSGTEVGGNLFFTNYHNGVTRFFVFDGTTVSEISTSNTSLPISNITNLTQVDGVLYFTATDATNGAEWRKYENGIATLLVDANPGSGNGVPTSVSGNMITNYNGSVFFNASNGTNGNELWKYNGTTAYMVQDLDAGSGSSSPADMILYNNELHFTASTPATGRELFSYVEIPDSASITFSDPVACHNDSTLQVPITIDNIASELGAISLVFDYDTTFMTYDTLASGHTNLNVALGSNFYINDYGGKMYISWASTASAAVENGDTLFTLQFLPKNAATFATIGSTLLTWDETSAENCELSDNLQEVLPSIYTDSLGKVIAPPIADLVNDLTNNTLCELETATFTASGGATYEFFVNDASQGAADVIPTYSSSILLDNDVVSVFVIDEDGCSSDTSNTIIVRGLPDILLTNDNTDNRICAGDTVNFTATGASEYTFFLNSGEIQAQSIDSTYFIIPADGDVIAVGGINTNTGCVNGGDSAYTLLLDGCYGTAGSIVYKNSVETPMGNVTATLTSGVDTVSVVTEVNVGTFNFTKLYDNEVYTFSATTGKTHGGINSTDALGIIQHAITVSTISGLELKAADVDGIGSVNATDALLVMQRFVQSINSFDAGDWVFEDTSYTMTTNFANQKIYSLAMGDVNGSYVPNISESPSVFLASTGNIKTNNGDVITLPVAVADAATIGALSIAFYFPSHLMTINHVELANGGNVIYNVQGDELRIAWADGSTLNLAAGDVLFNIEATINDAADLANYPITTNNISEIANNQAIPFTNITLEMPTFAATTSVNGVGTAAIPVRNFPNPFSTSTTIEYTLPATGDVTMVIRNATGSEVRTIVNATQTAGTHQVRINGDDLATGTYFYTITVQEDNRSYTVTKRMVVLK